MKTSRNTLLAAMFVLLSGGLLFGQTARSWATRANPPASQPEAGKTGSCTSERGTGESILGPWRYHQTDGLSPPSLPKTSSAPEATADATWSCVQRRHGRATGIGEHAGDRLEMA